MFHIVSACQLDNQYISNGLKSLKWFKNLRSRSRARRPADWKRSVHVSTWAFQFAGQRSHL